MSGNINWFHSSNEVQTTTPTPSYISSFSTFTGSWTASNDGPFVGATSWRFTGGIGQIIQTTDIDVATNQDFTVELWIKQTTNNTYGKFLSVGNDPGDNRFSKFAYYLSSLDGNVLYIGFLNPPGYSSIWLNNFGAQSNYMNNWVHYACVRKNNVFKMYVNGVALAPTTTTGAGIVSGTNRLTVGGDTYPGRVQGYYSNIRWTHAAVYDGNFATPSSNFTALPETKVLLVGP